MKILFTFFLCVDLEAYFLNILLTIQSFLVLEIEYKKKNTPAVFSSIVSIFTLASIIP